jgi:hypothetical protein
MDALARIYQWLWNAGTWVGSIGGIFPVKGGFAPDTEWFRSLARRTVWMLLAMVAFTLFMHFSG